MKTITNQTNLINNTDSIQSNSRFTVLDQIDFEREINKREHYICITNILEQSCWDSALESILSYFVGFPRNNKHQIFHFDLLSLLKDDLKTNLIKSLTILIGEQSLSYSEYLDRNALAMKIGQKLMKKKYKKILNLTDEVKTKYIAFSLGLNFINVLAHLNFIKYKLAKRDNRNISYITVNKAFLTEEITANAKKVRTGNIMLVNPKPHTSTQMGGRYTDSITMLNSNGFSDIQLQPDYTNRAINKLQNVAYNLTDLPEEFATQYLLKDKFYDKDGKELVSEKSKFLSDVLAIGDNKFFFPMAYDNRGRIYDRSHYIKLQGDSYQKAMYEFNNKEVLSEEGLVMLKVAITNEVYNDKVSYEDAVKWFDNNLDRLPELVKENPIAYNLYTNGYLPSLSGKAIGSITHWDATNSGLQFYSILGKDKVTASLCNVFNTGAIADAYKVLANSLNQLTGKDTFTRSNVKKAFMTFLYGALKANILFGIEDSKNGVTKGIREFFPAEWDEDKCWDTFTSAMEEIAPSAIKLMNLIFKYNINGKDSFEWTMPDGFKVQTKTVVTYGATDAEGKLLNDNRPALKGWFIDKEGKTHEGSIAYLRQEYDAYSRALAPNVIHSVDSYFLREVVRRCDFDISTIHDSFGVHPNNAIKLQEIVRTVAAEMTDSTNLLEGILSQLSAGMTARFKAKGELFQGEMTGKDVLESKYIIR